MKRIILLIVAATAIYSAIVVEAPLALAAKTSRTNMAAKEDGGGSRRIALVIGNGSYKSSPLKNPVNDARSVAATLRRLGFEVEERVNLRHVQMNQVVEDFGARLGTGDIGLFFYAGHGMQVHGANYLIPVDARINDENEVRYKALDVAQVLAKMEKSKSEVNIVILDACRDNPFARSFRSASRGLATMVAPSGTFIAYATAPGKTAADGSGKNGLYTSELISVLEEPGQTLEDVFKRALKAVREKSSGQQTPWVASNLEKDFYFVSPVAKAEPQPDPDPDPVPDPPPGTPSSLVDPFTGIEFIKVPGGCFHMGDFRGENKLLQVLPSDEYPVHKVCLEDFLIGKYPVTQKQWVKVMGNNPAEFSGCGDDCPVESVSWDDVQDFIEKLNHLTGKKYTLPTEAEWEFACRSGGNNERYCGGNDLDPVGWFSKNSGDPAAPEAWYSWAVPRKGGGPHPVGQKQPNGLGIYDMSGNVWQWIQDWYDKAYYNSGVKDAPRGPADGKVRVCRGGSWSNGAGDARASRRNGKNPGDRSGNLGFRLAAPAP